MGSFIRTPLKKEHKNVTNGFSLLPTGTGKGLLSRARHRVVTHSKCSPLSLVRDTVNIWLHRLGRNVIGRFIM